MYIDRSTRILQQKTGTLIVSTTARPVWVCLSSNILNRFVNMQRPRVAHVFVMVSFVESAIFMNRPVPSYWMGKTPFMNIIRPASRRSIVSNWCCNTKNMCVWKMKGRVRVCVRARMYVCVYVWVRPSLSCLIILSVACWVCHCGTRDLIPDTPYSGSLINTSYEWRLRFKSWDRRRGAQAAAYPPPPPFPATYYCMISYTQTRPFPELKITDRFDTAVVSICIFCDDLNYLRSSAMVKPLPSSLGSEQ